MTNTCSQLKSLIKDVSSYFNDTQALEHFQRILIIGDNTALMRYGVDSRNEIKRGQSAEEKISIILELFESQMPDCIGDYERSKDNLFHHHQESKEYFERIDEWNLFSENQ